MKVFSVLYRFRLTINLLALAVVLSALFLSPVKAGRECEGGCISWNDRLGCLVYQTCCVEENGSWSCTQM